MTSFVYIFILIEQKIFWNKEGLGFETSNSIPCTD